MDRQNSSNINPIDIAAEKNKNEKKLYDDLTFIWLNEYDESVKTEIMLDRDTDSEINENGDDLGPHKAESAVVQIAKLVAVNGWPDTINFAKQTPNEPDFDYDNFKDNVLKEIYLQFTDFKKMSLVEIGNKLIEIEAEDEKKISDAELTNRFFYLLTDKPQLHYHPEKADDLGEAAKCSDEIILIWERVNGHLVSMDSMLDRDGDAERNDVRIETGFHEAEPTVVQIAKQVAVYGEPKSINYARYDTQWRIGAKTRLFHEVVIEYSVVADEILRLARGIDSSYKNMSLAEIGKCLLAAKKQENG